jgi:hypothetical protein
MKQQQSLEHDGFLKEIGEGSTHLIGFVQLKQIKIIPKVHAPISI